MKKDDLKKNYYPLLISFFSAFMGDYRKKFRCFLFIYLYIFMPCWGYMRVTCEHYKMIPLRRVGISICFS